MTVNLESGDGFLQMTSSMQGEQPPKSSAEARTDSKAAKITLLVAALVIVVISEFDLVLVGLVITVGGTSPPMT